MGNYASCALANVKQSSKVGKVILPTREVKQFNQPTKAAELMLEIPNYFVVNSRSLQIGRRFSPLNADEDLDMGNVYVMFPMQRVNSMVNAGDLGGIYLIVTKRGASKVRVVPASSGEVIQSESSAPEENARGGERMDELCSPEVQHRRSVCRSRKPALETIAEEPICSYKLFN